MATRKTDLSESAALAIILSGLVGIVGIMLVSIAVVAAVVNSGKPDSAEAGAPAGSSRPVLSREAAAIATINAATQISSQSGSASTITQVNATGPMSEGERLFQMTCLSCHGQDARGIAGLGKDLVDSTFVNTTDDLALVEFLKTGRPVWDPANTSGVEMPARGGNPALTDDQLLAIVGYMRSLGNHPVAVAVETQAPTGVDSRMGVGRVSTVAGNNDAALIEAGRSYYMTSCTACHGADARGMVGLGKDLVASEFLHNTNDETLVAFLKTGRPIWDPANTTGIEMPARGGNPALTDEHLIAIVAYLRSLN